ncbi:zinc finger, CCHC-type containing protein [Tanacetum coccineum]
MHTVRRDGVADIKQRRRDLSFDGVRNLAMTSGRGRIKEDLASSTWRRHVNPIRTLGDYSKPSHEGYKNTIKLLVGNNVVPLRSDSIRERTSLRLFQFSLRDQASNWLERLPAGSITIWEDLTTRFLAQFFLPRRTAKLGNDILMF